MSLQFDTHILPLLISIEVHFILIAVESDLVIHTVSNSGAEKRLIVLQSLARPDDKNIADSDSGISGIPVCVIIILYQPKAEVMKILTAH